MRSFHLIFVAVLLSILAAYATVKVTMPHVSGTPKKESVYDRVLRTGTLRCGYLIYPPNLMMDVNKKQLSGVFYDAIEAIGKELNLKVVWQEEGAYDNLIEGLKTNRFDAICSGLWENPAKASVVDFSDYFYFNELAVYARKDDKRFDHNLSQLNDPSVTFATIDGAIADQIAKSEYPLAKRHALPPLSDYPQLLMEVASRKADVTISATQEILTYDQNNQNQLRKIITDKPFRLYPNVIFVRKGEYDLLASLNVALHQINHTGKLEAILQKYETQPGTLVRVGNDYKAQ